MEGIREFFYWTASIAFILFGLFVILLFAFLIYIKRLADEAAARFEEMQNSVAHATRTWRNLSITRFIIRTLRIIL